MKKLMLASSLLTLFLSACAGPDQTITTANTSVESDTLVTTLNTVIQSDAVQNAQFKFADDCDPSTLNNMVFCDVAQVKGDITTSVVDQVCVDACDAAYDICHGGCSTIDWTCNNCCTKECKSVRSSCKDLCGYLDVKLGSYLYRIETIKGVGALNALSVSNPVVGADPNVFSVDIAMNIPSEVLAHTYYDIIGISGHIDLKTTGATATATGALTDICGDGYYLQLDSLVISIPDDIFDSNLLTEIAQELGIEVSALTGGVVDLNALLLAELNDIAASETMKAINSALATQKIAPSDCEI